MGTSLASPPSAPLAVHTSLEGGRSASVEASERLSTDVFRLGASIDIIPPAKSRRKGATMASPVASAVELLAAVLAADREDEAILGLEGEEFGENLKVLS